jgi:hypothetical protein
MLRRHWLVWVGATLVLVVAVDIARTVLQVVTVYGDVHVPFHYQLQLAAQAFSGFSAVVLLGAAVALVVAATFADGARGLRPSLWATALLGGLIVVVAVYAAVDPPGSAIFGGFNGDVHGSALNVNQRAVGVLGGIVAAAPAALAALLASAALRSRAHASSEGDVDAAISTSPSGPVQESPGERR